MVDNSMYVRIKELKEIGFKKNWVANELKLDSKTVDKYWNMTDEYSCSGGPRFRCGMSHHSGIIEPL